MVDTKGIDRSGENAETAARREFNEELGLPAQGRLQPLGTIRQRGGKLVEAFALEGDLDVEQARSSRFELEWPPGSGRLSSFPEVDRAAWFTLAETGAKLLASQLPLRST